MSVLLATTIPSDERHQPMPVNATVNATMHLNRAFDDTRTRATTSTTSNRPDDDAKREMVRLLIQRIGQHRYDMWFGRSSFAREGDAVHVTVESAFVSKWIRSRFTEELNVAAQSAFGRKMSVDVRAAANGTPTTKNDSRAKCQAANKSSQRHDHHSAEETQRPPHTTSGAPRRRCGTQSEQLTVAQARQLRDLRDFVVGPSNELAYVAACQVSDCHDALGCSPLLVHGPCGVGKTHLLQGICRRLLANAPRGTRVRYVTAEQFTNEYIAAVQQNRLGAFRQAVRNLYLLAIDDMHFLSNKSRTQTEFLHTLDAIDMNGSRVVIASDNHPRRMSQLNQALVSRLLSGMVVEIGLPDERMRIQLIELLAQQRSMNMTQHAVRTLAQRCTGSVRELEGALTKIRALWTVQRSVAAVGTKSAVDSASSSNGSTHNGHQQPQIGRIIIEQLFADPSMMARPIHINCIIEAVCRRLSIALGDLTGNGRHKRIVLARGLIAYLGREMTTMSFPEIARAMGRRNHSTVHTATTRIQKQLENGGTINADPGGQPIVINELLDQLRSTIHQRKEH